MTEEATQSHLEISPVLGSAKVIFSIDPKTLLFQTHKSEDVSVLQNRISLLEIHEVLMEINLNLIPSVKLIQRAYVWYMVGLVMSSLLMLCMLVFQNISLLKPVIGSFILVHLWLIGIIIAKKKIYDRIISRVLKNKQELYDSNGLSWKFKSSYLPIAQTSTFQLELYRNNVINEIDTTERNAHIDVDDKNEERDEEPQVERFADLYKVQRLPETFRGSARKNQVSSNFTLGPGMHKNGVQSNAQYSAIDVGIVESTRVRKPSH